MEQRKSNSTQGSRKSTPAARKPRASLSRDEERSIDKKKQTRMRHIRQKLVLLALAFVVLCVSILLVLTVFFKINTVNITGEKFYSDEQVISCSQIEVGDSLFSVNEEKLNEILPQELPYIKAVKVTRKLPDTLNIEVELTRETAAFINGEAYILVDSAGKVLDKDSAMLRENVAVVSGVKIKNAQEGSVLTLTNKDLTENFITIISALKDSGLVGITEITLSQKGEFRLIYEDRITIKLGAMEHLADKLKRAKVVIDDRNEKAPLSEGVLDLGTWPDVYFDPGEEEELTIPAHFVTDADGNVMVDENGDFLTTQAAGEQAPETTAEQEE